MQYMNIEQNINYYKWKALISFMGERKRKKKHVGRHVLRKAGRHAFSIQFGVCSLRALMMQKSPKSEKLCPQKLMVHKSHL